MIRIHRYEFDCKCGCGKNNTTELLLFHIRIARDKSGVPYHINSGCRCELNNGYSGGSSTSSHLRGLAVDIRCLTIGDRFRIKEGLYYAGFRRIGHGPDFIHADIDRSKDQMVEWDYD